MDMDVEKMKTQWKWKKGEGTAELMRQLSVNFLKLLIMRRAQNTEPAIEVSGPNDVMCLFDKQNVMAIAIETFWYTHNIWAISFFLYILLYG